MEKELNILVLDILGKSKTPIPTNHIVKELNDKNVKKSDVNKILYALEKQKQVVKIEGIPPLWFIDSKDLHVEKKQDVLEENKPKTFIFIDCDNSPCLREASYYVDDNSKTCIYALASPQYNNFVPESHKNITFQKLMEDEVRPSIISCMFGAKIAEIFYQKEIGKYLKFIIVSKDKVAHTISYVYENCYNKSNYNHEFIVIDNGWEGLRIHLE